jgi:hypothetical protein
MRVASPEDGNTYLKGQIIEYGQLDNRTGGGEKQHLPTSVMAGRTLISLVNRT